MLAVVGMMLPMNSGGTVLDLTTDGTSGSVVGSVGGTAWFYTELADPTPAGTGLIDSFVRINATGTEQGYNTGFRPVQFDENTSPTFTRNPLLSTVPVVSIGGIAYREFLLDINQTANNPLLSLDMLQIFISSTANNTGYPSLGTLIYDLGTNNNVLMDYRNENGSGEADMLVYIPSSLFDSATYVYLYSSFGSYGDNTYASNDGFEEWAVRTQTAAVPEPGTLLLLGSGLVGLAGWGRKKFGK